MATKKTPSTALSPELRAQHSLSFENEGKALTFEETKARLAILRDDSRNLTEITDIDSRKVVHDSYMVLKNTRITIENTAKAARADALAFQKAVISKEKELVDVISDEELRLKKLRDDFDSIEEARLAEIAQAERDRLALVESNIRAMREAPLDVVGKSAAEIDRKLAWLLERDDESYEGDYLAQAQKAKRDSAATLRAMLADAGLREEQEAEAAIRKEALDKKQRELDEAEAARKKADDERQAELDRQAAELREQQAAFQKKIDDAAAEERAKKEAADAEAAAAEAARLAEEQRVADEAMAAALAEQQEAERKAREAADAETLAEMERIVATVTLDEAVVGALEWMRVAGGETSLAYRSLNAAFNRHQEK